MKLPTALFGYVSGPLRWEGQNGFEMYQARQTKWVFDIRPTVVGHGPICITHLQKESKFGFLLFWPFCLHVWIMPKLQETDADGNYVPGTEKGFYARTPGFRFDFADWTYIKTRGYAGGHLD